MFNKKKIFLQLFLVLFLLSSIFTKSVNADSTVTLNPTADTYIAEGVPDVSRQSSQVVWIGYEKNKLSGQPSEFKIVRGLIKFDLTPVNGKTVTKAVLKLYLYGSYDNVANTQITAYKTNDAWSENSTWNTLRSLTWDTATGVTQTVGNIADAPYNWNVTNIVKTWITDTSSNNGIILLGNESIDDDHLQIFWSKDCTATAEMCGVNKERQPQLVVTYSDAPATCGFQGNKVGSNVTNQQVTCNNSAGSYSNNANPYFISNIPSGDYTCTVSNTTGYQVVGYSYCANATTGCHDAADIKTGSTTETINCPANGYVDLWWHFAPSTQAPTLTTAPSCKKSLGDANCDGKVDDADYSIWQTEFSSGQGSMSDFDGNQKVDLIDYEIWRRNSVNIDHTADPKPTSTPNLTPSYVPPDDRTTPMLGCPRGQTCTYEPQGSCEKKQGTIAGCIDDNDMRGNCCILSQ